MKVLIILLTILLSLNADWTSKVKESTIEAYEKTKESSIEAYEKTVEVFSEDNLTITQKRKKHFNKIWNDLFKDFDAAAELEDKLVTAPDKAWLTSDKNDIQEDINEIISDIIEYLSQDDLLSYREEIK